MHRRSTFLPLLAVLALLLSACGGAPSTPLDAMASAFRTTAEQSFAWQASLELDQEALSALTGNGGDSAQALAIAQTLQLRGVHHSARHSSFSVEAMGFEVVEMRQIGDDTYLRVNVASFAAMAGASISDEMLSQMGLGDLDGKTGELARAAVDGQWVGVTGMTEEFLAEQQERQQEQLSELGGVEPDLAEIRDLMEDLAATYLEDIRSTFEDFTTITEAGPADPGTRYDVRFALHTFLRDVFPRIEEAAKSMDAGDEVTQQDLEDAIAASPESLGGLSFVVDGGLIHHATFDIGAFLTDVPDAADSGIAPGAFLVEVALTEHGAAAEIEAPDAVTITAEEFVTLSEEFSQSMPGDVYGADDAGNAAAKAELRNLAVLQETFFVSNGRYATSFGELASEGFEASPDFLYGMCTYADTGFVLSVSSFDGSMAFYDSEVGVVTDDPSQLGCFPDYSEAA